MREATITAGATEARELQIELLASVDKASYPRGIKIKEVKLKRHSRSR
jgi:hypothetical protein